MCKQILLLAQKYQHHVQLFFDPFIESEEPLREQIINYIGKQQRIQYSQAEAIRKDVLRLYPSEQFFQSAKNRIKVFQMTYILTEILNVEHCQGFDDIGGICYYLSYKAFELLEKLHTTDPQLQIIHDQLKENDFVVEAIALSLYQHLINYMIVWFTDAPQYTKNDGESLQDLTQRLLVICNEICPNSYEILKKVEAPVELFVCRIARTLFSRELEIEQIKHLWDFVLIDGFINQQPLRMVGELTALFLFNSMQQFILKYPDVDINECQSALFQQNKQFSKDEQIWKGYINQLQFILQQTSKRFDPPPYCKNYLNNLEGLKMMNKHFYETEQKHFQLIQKKKKSVEESKWEQLQLLQLDTSNQLNQLLQQLLKLQTNQFQIGEFRSTIQTLYNLQESMKTQKPGNYNGKPLVLSFDAVYEQHYQDMQQQLFDVGMKICSSPELVNKVISKLSE
uniref:Rab-GTPase-TBC domain-containing protein n=1 Tax=Trepomonas sp. PC1 TaxID=1076344 RepID=A0A146KES0_9EUKA|eukprot:JAP93996.1 Rab-GTPase-TBC domain-containing protein [Trepomonas sp. PC1]